MDLNACMRAPLSLALVPMKIEAGSNHIIQIEYNKKREFELSELKSELEKANIVHEGTLNASRQKHSNTMTGMKEWTDSPNKI